MSTHRPVVGVDVYQRMRRRIGLVCSRDRRARINRWAVWLLICGVILGAQAQAPVTAPEYQVKAAFLFQFSRFVQWPAGAFEDEHAPLIICVLGPNPFGFVLQEITANEAAYAHPLLIEFHQDVNELERCHIVFVSGIEVDLGRQALRHLSGRTILTVGDSADFSKDGGVIGLVTVDGKVRVQVNRSAAQAAQLKISAKLLRVADLIG